MRLINLTELVKENLIYLLEVTISISAFAIAIWTMIAALVC